MLKEEIVKEMQQTETIEFLPTLADRNLIPFIASSVQMKRKSTYKLKEELNSNPFFRKKGRKSEVTSSLKETRFDLHKNSNA